MFVLVRRRAVLALGCSVLSGCHTYVPVESPVPGSVARVRVPVRSALADPSLPPDTASVEGIVIEADDTVVLEVRTRRVIGIFDEFLHESTYRVSRDELAAIELREFSPRRSATLATAVLGGAAFLAFSAFGGEAGSGGRKPGNGGNQSFTVRLGGW